MKTPFGILIVDDNECVIHTAKTAFEHCARKIMTENPDVDITVTCARSGDEAIKAARANSFDLIIMDICMPVMDGLEATRIIRSMPNYRDCVIAGFSCLSGKDITVRMYQSGIDTILNKPTRVEQITMLIETVMTMRCGGYS